MTSFVLDSNDLYVACSTKTKKAANFPKILQVYRLKNSVKDYMVMDDDWDMKSYTIDPRSTSGYNSLVINGSTVDINMLTEDLFRSRLRVNHLGNCLYKIPQSGPFAASTALMSSTNPAENFRYYRMNDLWNWAVYGAKADPNEEQGCTRWDRLDILHGTPIIFNQQEMEHEFVKMKNDLEVSRQLISSLEDDKFRNKIRKDLQRQIHKGGGTTMAHYNNNIYTPILGSLSNLQSNPISPNAFQIMYLPFKASQENFYLRDYKCAVRTVNPMLSPVTEVSNSVFTIFMYDRESDFDTNNWFRMTTAEMQCTPLLVYLGHRYFMKIGSSNVTTPFDPNTPHFYSYSLESDTCFRPFFGIVPVMLAGFGIKFCLIVNYSDTLDKSKSTPEETTHEETDEEGVGLCHALRNLLKFR